MANSKHITVDLLQQYSNGSTANNDARFVKKTDVGSLAAKSEVAEADLASALATKATGFPNALVSAMLATGLTLADIPCGKYGTLDK